MEQKVHDSCSNIVQAVVQQFPETHCWLSKSTVHLCYDRFPRCNVAQARAQCTQAKTQESEWSRDLSSFQATTKHVKHMVNRLLIADCCCFAHSPVAGINGIAIPDLHMPSSS